MNTISEEKPIKSLITGVDLEKDELIMKSEASVTTTETESSGGDDDEQDCRDENGVPFRRMPPKRSSLSAIKLAVAVVENEKAEVDEATQEKVMRMNQDLPKKPLKRLGNKLLQKWPPKPSKKLSTLRPFLEESFAGDKNSQKIKEMIEYFETIYFEKMQKKMNSKAITSDDYDDCPTMKLRASFLDETGKSKDSFFTETILNDVTLSPGQSLPLPSGCSKHRRVSYRISFQSEEEEHLIDDDMESRDGSIGSISTRRNSAGGICGYNRPTDELASDRPRRRKSMGDALRKSERSCMGQRGFRRPDVWITPLSSNDGSRKWIAKRVWDIEDKDDEEPEYEVEHSCLMDGIRGLLDIPEDMGKTTDEWQVNIDESDPWATAAEKDSAPNFPSRRRIASRDSFTVKKVVDIDGQQYGNYSSFVLSEADFDSQFEHITDLSTHEGNRISGWVSITRDQDESSKRIRDLDSTGISFVNYSDGETSASVSLSTDYVDNYCVAPLDEEIRKEPKDEVEQKHLHKNERWLSTSKNQDSGFDPNSWMRQLCASSIKSGKDEKIAENVRGDSLLERKGNNIDGADKTGDQKGIDKSKNPIVERGDDSELRKPDWWTLTKDDDHESQTDGTKASRSVLAEKSSAESVGKPVTQVFYMNKNLTSPLKSPRSTAKHNEYKSLADQLINMIVSEDMKSPLSPLRSHGSEDEVKRYKTLVDYLLQLRVNVDTDDESSVNENENRDEKKIKTKIRKKKNKKKSKAIDVDDNDSSEQEDEKVTKRKKKKTKSKIFVSDSESSESSDEDEKTTKSKKKKTKKSRRITRQKSMRERNKREKRKKGNKVSRAKSLPVGSSYPRMKSEKKIEYDSVMEKRNQDWPIGRRASMGMAAHNHSEVKLWWHC